MRVVTSPTLREDIVAHTAPWAHNVAHRAVAAIGAASPKRTGFLTTSIRHEIRTGRRQHRVRITLVAPYATYVDQGTGIYGPRRRRITPRTAKALRWISDGRVHYARSVRGQPGQRFVRTGLTATFGPTNVREYRWGRSS